MGKVRAAVAAWFAGKKTILGGLVVMAAAVAGVWTGKLDAVTGVGLFGFGLSVAGYGDKANRHQAELLTALQDVAKAGYEQRAGEPLKAIAGELLSSAAPLLPGIAATAGASLHISGATAADVTAIAQSVVLGVRAQVKPAPEAAAK
jgi:hypothetical protein